MTDTNSSYQEYQNKIKQHLAQWYEQQKLKLEELLAILYILGQAEDEKTLQFFVRGFSPSFPVLADLIMDEQQVEKESYDDQVQQLMSELIKKDPLQAVALAKEAMQGGMTIEELKNKYTI